MRIGIDATCWANRRGFGRFTRELILALQEMDSQHEFVYFLDHASAASFDPAPKHRRVVVPTSETVTEAARAGGYRSPADLLKMSMHVFQESLDWMYFPTVYSYFPVWNPCRIAVTIHDTIAETYPQYVFPTSRDRWFWKWKGRLACMQADLMVTVSELSRRTVAEEYGVAKEKFCVLTEAPDPVFFANPEATEILQVCTRLGISEQQRFFLYVGGISPHKNLKTLLDVFRREAFADHKLVIVGDYSADSFLTHYPEMQNLARQSGATSRILFTGYLEDREVLALLKGSTALILPSFCEGFGLPAVEAMAAGTPVICTERSAIPEIAPDAALFVDPNQPESLFGAMVRMQQEPQLRAQLSVRGKAIAGKLSWKSAAETLLTALTAN